MRATTQTVVSITAKEALPDTYSTNRLRFLSLWLLGLLGGVLLKTVAFNMAGFLAEVTDYTRLVRSDKV